MKKLSLLVATLLIATIGGVYAAFIYPGQTGGAKGEVNRAIYLEQATQSGNIGDFTLSSDINKISLDQKKHDPELVNSDYTVVMTTTYNNESENPNIKIVFKPKTGANATIKSKCVDSYIYFGFVSSHKYDDPTTTEVESLDIFTVPNYDAAHCITIHNTDYVGTEDQFNYKWTRETDGTFSVTLTAITSVDQMVQLANTFVLDTIEEYEAFKQAMGDELVNLIVTATTVKPGTGA